MSLLHGKNLKSITDDVDTGVGEERDVPKLIENTIKGLLYLLEHVEFLVQNEYWEAEMGHILSLAEELDHKLESIVEKEEVNSWSGESLKH